MLSVTIKLFHRPRRSAAITKNSDDGNLKDYEKLKEKNAMVTEKETIKKGDRLQIRIETGR